MLLLLLQSVPCGVLLLLLLLLLLCTTADIAHTDIAAWGCGKGRGSMLVCAWEWGGEVPCDWGER